MRSAPSHRPAAGTRRIPQQSRSRDRVERILDTAATQVVAEGVDSMSTRTIAQAAGVPVASLYQYFADKEGVLLALVERDLEDLERQVRRAIADLEQPTPRQAVEAVLDALVTGYRSRPALVMTWLHGRTNPAIRAFRREHNRAAAQQLYAAAADRGWLTPDAEGCHSEIGLELADRLFQLAFERAREGDPVVLDELRRVVGDYVERYTAYAG